MASMAQNSLHLHSSLHSTRPWSDLWVRGQSPYAARAVQLVALGHVIALSSFLLSPYNGKCGQKSSEGEGDHISPLQIWPNHDNFCLLVHSENEALPSLLYFRCSYGRREWWAQWACKG